MKQETKDFLFLIQETILELAEENKKEKYDKLNKVILENKVEGIDLDEVIEKELIKKI